MRAVLHEFKDVFATELPAGVPQDRNAFEMIPMEPHTVPPFKPMYRLSPLEREEVIRQIKELLSKGLIEPSLSPYGAPILFVKKKDGSLRMVIDYRSLNKLTVKNRYPLPRIDDLLDQLQGAKIFSSLDLLSGYHQVPIHASDIPKTAFRTPQGSFQFKVLSMGLTNAPSTFAHVMNNVFKDLLGKSVLIYLDDILVFSKDPGEHVKHVREVMEVLRAHKLYAKLAKCEFGKEKLAFLGHVVSAEGIQVDPKKAELVKDWPTPQNVGEVRKFLGFANYFRKFLQGFANVCRPLNNLLKKDHSFLWDEECDKAFIRLKEALVTAPVLALPDFSKPNTVFDVICDASGFGIGAVLMQYERPIAYEGRKMQDPETRYPVGEQELLAVHYALQKWRCYLEGSVAVNVITDHAPNTWLPSQPNLSRRQARWSEFLQRFKLTWVYRPGRTNVADPISRNPAFLPSIAAIQEAVIQEADTQDAPSTAAASSAETSSAFQGVGKSILSGYALDKDFGDTDFVRRHELVQEGGFWYKGDQLAVPAEKEIRKECIVLVHTPPYCGHLGGNRTFQAARQLFWWVGMKGDALAFVKDCGLCQRNKHPNNKPFGFLQPLRIPDFRWESVSMDFIVQLPMTKKWQGCNSRIC